MFYFRKNFWRNAKWNDLWFYHWESQKIFIDINDQTFSVVFYGSEHPLNTSEKTFLGIFEDDSEAIKAMQKLAFIEEPFFTTKPTSTSLSIALETCPWSLPTVSTIYFWVHLGDSRISSSTSFCVAPRLASLTSSPISKPCVFHARYFSHQHSPTTEMTKSPLSGVGAEGGKQWIRLRICWIARD